MAEANAELKARVAQPGVTVSQLFQAARLLERAYALKGFILARVIVPAQRLNKTTAVRVQVIDGFIEDIDTTGLPETVKAAVLARVGPLKGQSHLTQAKIERALLIAGQLGGLQLRSAFAAGKTVGGVRLVLEGTMRTAVVRITADNQLPSSLGHWQMSNSLVLSNLFRGGEQLYVTSGSQIAQAGIGAFDSPLSMIGGGLSLPAGNHGVTLGAEYLHSETRPHPVAGVPESAGLFSRWQMRANVPLILSRPESLNLSLSLDGLAQKQRLIAFDALANRDRYTAVRIKLGWQRWFSRTPVSATIAFAQALEGAVGTISLPNSRQGVSSKFRHLGATLNANVPFLSGFSFDLSLRGQTGFGKPQYLSEQFSLVAANALSTFTAGSVNADSGATARTELRLPVANLARGTRTEAYLFAAGGSGTLAEPTAIEQRLIKAAALGFGARISRDRLPWFKGVGTSLGIEIGHQFTNIPGRRSGDRVNLTLSFGS